MALKRVDAKLAALFIRNDTEDYLREIIHQDCHYLGKFAGEVSDCHHLRLLEVNIYSLLKKIVPGYPCEGVPLQLFPVSMSTFNKNP